MHLQTGGINNERFLKGIDFPSLSKIRRKWKCCFVGNRQHILTFNSDFLFEKGKHFPRGFATWGHKCLGFICV